MDNKAKVYTKIISTQNTGTNKLIDRIKSENPNEKYEIILDIGCGTGNVTQMLTELLDVKQVFALDIKENMIEFAKQNHCKENITYLIQDFGLDWDNLSPEIRSLKGRVSLIFSAQCLQWIKERENVGKNIRNLLSNNGKFYATVYCFPNLYKDLTPEQSLITEKEFIKIPTEGQQLEAWRNTLQLNETNNNSIKTCEENQALELKAFEEFYRNVVPAYFSIYFTSATNLSDKDRIDDLLRRYRNMICKQFIDQNTGKQMINIWYNYFEFGLTNTKQETIG